MDQPGVRHYIFFRDVGIIGGRLFKGKPKADLPGGLEELVNLEKHPALWANLLPAAGKPARQSRRRGAH